MPTPTFLTGFEHGIVVTGSTPTPNERIWHTVTTTGGAPTINTTTFKNGARSLRCPGGGAGSWVGRTTSGSPNIGVASFWIRFDGAVPSADCNLFTFVASASSFGFLRFMTTDSTLRASFGGTHAASGFVVAADTWYLVDLKVNLSANPRTVDLTVDGSAQASVSLAVAAGTIPSWRCGTNVDTTTATAPVFYDDLVISHTSGDYPMGDHAVLRMSPDADGTHSFTNNDFIQGDSGSGFANSATNIWTFIEEFPFGALNTTDSVQQNVIRTTGYIEIQFDASPDAADGWGVQVHGQFDSDGTGANTSGMRLWDGTTEDTLYAPPQGDVSNTTETYLTHCRALNPSGGAWTQTVLDAIRVRWGFSGDVTNSPILHALMIEVAFPVTGGGGGATASPYYATYYVPMVVRAA